MKTFIGLSPTGQVRTTTIEEEKVLVGVRVATLTLIYDFFEGERALVASGTIQRATNPDESDVVRSGLYKKFRNAEEWVRLREQFLNGQN